MPIDLPLSSKRRYFQRRAIWLHLLGAMSVGSGLAGVANAADTVTPSTSTGTASSEATASDTSSPAKTVQLQTITVSGEAPTQADQTNGYVTTRASSATKTNTPVIETPQSISTVTRKQMDDQNVQTVTEALRYMPGVVPEIRGGSAAGDPYLYSRGFVLEQYLDGARLPSDTASFGYALPSFDTYGLERIDVVRGPASVLYGQANPGGVANLVSKAPTDTPVHEMFLGFGNNDHERAGFDLGGPLDNDGTLSYRLTGDGDVSHTQVQGVKQEHVFVAPSVTWRPDADTSLTLTAKYQRDPDIGYYNYLPAQGSLYDTARGKVSEHTNLGDSDFDHHSKTQATVGYEFEHRFADGLTFRQNLHYYDIKDDLANVFTNGLASGSDSIANRYAFTSEERARFFTVDNQLEYKFATGALSHTALVGLDYQRILYHQTTGLGAAPSLDLYSPVYLPVAQPATSYDEYYRMSQVGTYAQDQIAFQKWRFLIGGREDWARNDAIDNLTSTSQQQSERAFTWRSGLVYLFDNGLAPYISFSKSFNPTEGTLYNGGLTKPTTAKQYEVGVKYQPPGYNSFITASLFDMTEYNVLTSDPIHSGYNTQAGQVRARGGELQGTASLTKNVSLIASYAYLSSVTVNSTDTATTIDGDSTSLAGKQTWGIPRNMASLWADYTLHSGLLNGLGFGADVRFMGKSEDESNSVSVPSYTLVDAGIHYDTGKHWLFALNASNLFNKQYVASCFSSTVCSFGEGVSVMGTATYRW